MEEAEKDVLKTEENQDLKTTENSKALSPLGQYAITGGPGRPPGLKNRYSLIKQDMLEVWQEEGGKERFRELFKGDMRDFLKALEKIVAIMPREVDLETQAVTYTMMSKVKIDGKDLELNIGSPIPGTPKKTIGSSDRGIG